jgi:hypothetical protein
MEGDYIFFSMMKKVSVCVLTLALAGCAGGPAGAPVQVCPVTGFMEHAQTAAFFANAAKSPKPADVNVYALMKNLKGECALKGKDEVDISFSFDVVAQKTALGQGIEGQNLSYFVALLSPQDDILQRAHFYTTVTFDKADKDAKKTAAQDSGAVTEEQTIRIPLTKDVDIAQDKLVVGFMLAPQQVEFNKAYSYDFPH